MADAALHVVSPIVEKIVGLATGLIKEEAVLVLGVKDDVEELSSKLTSIQAVLCDAEERQMEEEHLRDWLRKLKDAADDAEDILDTFATEMFLWKRRHEARKIPTPISASEISIRYGVAREIKKILQRVDGISKEKEEFHLNIGGGRSQSPDRQPTDFFVHTRDVFGREGDKEKIINLLQSDEEGNLSVIPIIGMGGLGKTTLAQLVFNDERVEQCFDLSRMWISVSGDFNLTRILRGMMESYSKMSLPADLSPNLVMSRFRDFLPGKRFLLVLDDVWNENYCDWEPLLQLLNLGMKGSKVLVTSRSQKVADVVGTQSPHLLECLPENECWSLFERIAFNKTNLPDSLQRDLEDTGKEIVAKCKGLPLAVKAVAGLLRGNTDPHNWRNVLRSNVWEHDQNVLPALKLSYNDLPSHLKQCFAFCSVFPKAYTFDKKDLVKLWMAQSFIQPKGQRSIQQIGAEYFDFLLMRSFFQSLNVHNRVQYRMHDLIHDLALSISGQQFYQFEDNKSCFQPENCRYWRHISLLCENVEEHFMNISDHSNKLRTLLLPRERLTNFGQALDKLFHSLRYIRALDLSSSALRKLPRSIEECKLLRYLDLSKTEIEQLPNSICNLYNLQTLKLLGCLCLFELPKDLGNLVNLSHLELDDMFWFGCTTFPASIGNLTILQNLPKFNVGLQNGYKISELKDMAYLTGSLHVANLENAVDAAEANMNEKEGLEKAVFEWTRDVNLEDEARQETVLQDLLPHSHLRELAIYNYGGSRFPLWMTDGQLRNLVSISLFNCRKCKDLSLHQLPNLRALYIKEMEELDILQCPAPALRVLKISNCNRLGELTQILPSLTALKIKKCASLKALPVTPSLMFLTLVDNLALEDCQEAMVQRIFRTDQGEHVCEPHPSLIGVLEMKVINCPKLQALPQVFAPQKLEISGCELLTGLPAPQFAKRLQHLALHKGNNGTLLRAIPHTNSLYTLVISDIANIVSLPKLPNLPGLKALYILNCEDLESLSEDEESFRSLTSLKLLSIHGCKKLVTLPNEGLPTLIEFLSIGSCRSLQSLGNKDTLKSLTSLLHFHIEDCPLLQSLPEDGLPISLQHLLIRNCEKLAERCDKEVGPEWPKIMDIPDLEIDFKQVSSAPELLKKKPSPWYLHFVCGKGLNSQIQMELGETSSTPPENGH